MPKHASTLRLGVASLLFFALGSINAAVITPGTPTTSVPSDLVDPLASLASGLLPDEFLLPIQITGANGLQDWSFDLNFDDSVVSPTDGGGLTQGVYPALFNASDPTSSDILSSGFPVSGAIETIAGFSSGASGDGLLTYVLFEFLPGKQDPFPAFSISGATINQTPEPGTVALLAAGLVVLGSRRLLRREQRN